MDSGSHVRWSDLSDESDMPDISDMSHSADRGEQIIAKHHLIEIIINTKKHNNYLVSPDTYK